MFNLFWCSENKLSDCRSSWPKFLCGFSLLVSLTFPYEAFRIVFRPRYQFGVPSSSHLCRVGIMYFMMKGSSPSARFYSFFPDFRSGTDRTLFFRRQQGETLRISSLSFLCLFLLEFLLLSSAPGRLQRETWHFPSRQAPHAPAFRVSSNSESTFSDYLGTSALQFPHPLLQ